MSDRFDLERETQADGAYVINPMIKPTKRGRTQRGTGYRRQQLTRAIVARDGSRCQPCGKVTTRPEVDHITPLSRGGTNNPSNLQTICHECHRAKTNREAKARSRRPAPRLLR